MCLFEYDLRLVAPEGLEVRDPADLDFRGVPVGVTKAPGVVYDPGDVGGRGSWSLAGRLDAEFGQARLAELGVTEAGVSARDVYVASAGAAISSARRLASLAPSAGRSRRGGVRQSGFPPAVEYRVKKAVLEGDLHAAAGDAFGGAAELVDDVAVVAVQQVDEGVPAGKEHVDVGADPVLPASCEDPAAAEVPGNAPAEHLGRYRVNDAARRGPQAGCGFGKCQLLRRFSGRGGGVAKALIRRIRSGAAAPWRRAAPASSPRMVRERGVDGGCRGLLGRGRLGLIGEGHSALVGTLTL